MHLLSLCFAAKPKKIKRKRAQNPQRNKSKSIFSYFMFSVNAEVRLLVQNKRKCMGDKMWSSLAFIPCSHLALHIKSGLDVFFHFAQGLIENLNYFLVG